MGVVDDIEESVVAAPLPAGLRLWSRVGGRCPIATRLRVSSWLCSRGLAEGGLYAGTDGLALAIDRDDPFQATMLLGLYDPVAVAVLHRYTTPGATVIDAGAHLGYLSMRLAEFVGPGGAVHAFECDPRLVPRLRRHVELNGLSWITVNASGLLDRGGVSDLFLPAQLGWSSTLDGAWGAQESAAVAMVALDEYVGERDIDPAKIRVIKLDVEGAELAALRGARETLRAAAAAVLVEWIPERMRVMGHEPSDLLDLMAEAGYAPFSPVLRHGRLQLTPGADPSVGEDILFLKPAHAVSGRRLAR